MAEEYRKIRKAILDDIAAAIRFQKKSTRQFNPADFAGIIKAMLTIPSAEAATDVPVLTITCNADGSLPAVYRAAAVTTIGGSRITSGVTGQLTE